MKQIGPLLSVKIVESSQTVMQFIALERPYQFASPFGGEDFAVMLWVVDTNVSVEEQADLSRQLVVQGCRYAVCAGHECSSWDDSIDIAFLETDPDFDPPDDRFVMTTWHEGEGVKEVAEFFARHTSFDNFVAERFLVLIVRRDKQLEGQAGDAVKTLLSRRAV